jgi:multidrug efflux pump subunit AcrB
LASLSDPAGKVPMNLNLLALTRPITASYILSSTLLPVLATWLVREAHGEKRGGLLARLKDRYQLYLEKVLERRGMVAGAYGLLAVVVLAALFPLIGTEIFPQSDGTQFELLIRAPTGTRVERTEEIALQALHVIEKTVGKQNIEVSTGFIGVHPPNYPVNHIFLWTTGPHEAVLQVALHADTTPYKGAALRERLRAHLHREIPGVNFSFQAGDIVSRVMSFGAPTPIEVAVQALITGALGRLRPILMTAMAMIAGMFPMALGLGEGGAQAAPLGRAVIGGLLFATAATLTALPVLYALLLGRASTLSPSLNPLDPRSRYYEPDYEPG